MGKRVLANIEPALLRWARESAHVSIEAAAKSIRTTPERVEDWEEGRSQPTVKQLRRLGRKYRRPLAVFYLPEPPQGFDALHDYRRLPGQVARLQSPQLAYEIRRAHSRRLIALDLCEALGVRPPDLTLRASLDEDPEQVSGRIRDTLSIAIEDQFGWEQGSDSFRHWRAAFERAGILVFEVTRVDIHEMRGFSVAQRPLPAVVVNPKDSFSARIFTLAHELTHVALQTNSLCDTMLLESPDVPPAEREVERFCNRVAAATLVPTDSLLTQDIVRSCTEPEQWTDEDIRHLGRRYGVSRQVILLRLLRLGRTTQSFCDAKCAQFREEFEDSERRKKKSRGGPSPANLALYTSGHLFVDLVLTSYHEQRITVSDVADSLGLRLKHLPKLESQLTQDRAALGGAF